MKPLLSLPLTPRSLTILILAGIVVALLITPPGAISGLDLIAYVSGFDLFSHGGNPYSAQELFRKQQEWSVQRDFPVAMWNPPIFFFYFAPIISLPPTIAPVVARSFSFLCALTLAVLGWRLADSEKTRTPLLPFILCAFGLLPFWEELRLAQNTSWVSLYVAAGTVLLFRAQRPYLAGALLAVALCKPHDFYLPLLVMAFAIVTARRWSVVGGAAASLLIAATTVHLIQPGIWSKWIFREQWPYVAYGANLTTLLHLVAIDPHSTSDTLLAFISPLLGALVWWRGVSLCRFTTLLDKVMWAWIITPFFAPYGFMSDHVTLIFSFSYFASRMFNEKNRSSQAQFSTRFFLLTLACFSLSLIPTTPIPLSWLLFAPGIIAVIYYSFRAPPRHAPN